MSEPCRHDSIVHSYEAFSRTGAGPSTGAWLCADCGADLVPVDRAAWIEVPPGERLISESDPEMVRLREIERAARAKPRTTLQPEP